jgi:2-polyprenyl-3-methyl-5-hydroxy-6-metoxy-1,4-benzoquinol methylase
MTSVLELGDVPFYWRTKASPGEPPSDIPARLPFAFTVDNASGLVLQRRDPQVLKWLERVYREDANVGYLQDGHALAESYGGEFIDFFARASALLPRPPRSAADIGCGGVYLLRKVRERGLTVKGIDPSPVTAAAGRRAGIEIVPDFYPSPSLTERFDVLFHYDVLEHVDDPVTFLRAHHANLADGGALVFAVPDCTHHIAMGDVSMVLHEHLNYFDAQSLAHVVRSAGFEPVLLEAAKHGGVLLCCARPSVAPAPEPRADAAQLFAAFRTRAVAALDAFAEVATREPELGLYVPLRAFAYLSRLPGNVKLRFFDDDSGLRGRFYDGFDVAVENRQDLVARPARQVVVCSLAFGARIAERVRAESPQQRVILWNELFTRA